MNRHTTVKKSLILFVAALMCVAVFLSACDGNAFKPNFTAPTGGNVYSNGGIAVQYGEWIYYINGYASSASAENTYVDTNDAPRVGSVVRIKAADIADILAINEKDDLSSTEKSKAIAKAVSEKTDIVVPKIYYSNNTTTASINGIYIFNDRLYILTPNDKLTAGGASQTSQSVLMSFKLDGSDPQRHFTFTDNSAQVWLYTKGDKVVATYILNSKLYTLELANDEKSVSNEITGDDETVSDVKFDEAANCLFFLDGDGSICKLALGDSDKTVIVDNSAKDDEEESTVSYTISSVNGGFVYYTKADSLNSDLDGVVLYYIDTNGDTYSEEIALNTASLTTYAWKNGKTVIVKPTETGFYGLYIVENKEGDLTCLLLPGFNEASIEVWKIVGDELYYSADGVMYVKNLKDFDAEELGDAYAVSTISTTYNWALPDRLVVDGHVYVFSFSSGAVTVAEFNVEKKTDENSSTFTKTVVDED
ncbi:MAG: hypothetical protein J1F66_01495 [Clostridiales bacterium]|nr:hypothetical protein [Clostridiales bacterium]